MRRKTTPPQRTGHLVLVGGGEDKRGELRVLRRAVEVSRATTVTVIPTASDYPRERAEEYQRAFSALGVAEILVADVRTRGDADSAEVAELVRRARLVFFTGGDQVRLVETLAETRVLNEIWTAFRHGTCLAGTSAGAAAAGEVTIYHGDGAGHAKGTVQHSPGFGFIDGLVVDTHFDTRYRLARLAQFLCSGGGLRGVGLAEDTALVVQPGGLAEVVGSGVVSVVDAAEVETTNFDTATDDGLLTVTGLGLGFLAPGTVFDLTCWRVTALPGAPAVGEIHAPRRTKALHEGLRAE
jgi:cyanophycinase